MRVYETDEVVSYLRERNILKPYLKAKKYFEEGHSKMIDLKLLQPKKNRLYQFRIDLKYRARGYYRENAFLVIEISDHQ